MGNQPRYAIGIDIGGTKIALGIVDHLGAICSELRLETDLHGGFTAIQEQILAGIVTLQREMDVPIQGVGMGVAGLVEANTGCVYFGPNLKWHNVPLQASMEKALNLPVKVINDVRAITWGEWLFGAGKGCKDLLCVYIGTGIGSGIVINGQILEGSANVAGEIGHMCVDFNGPRCTCGNKGCLEAFAGGWGITARTIDAINTNRLCESSKQLLALCANDLSRLSAKIVFQAYREGDEIANQVVEQAKQALIAGCINLMHLFNPAKLILGGGLVDGFPEIIEILKEGVLSQALKPSIKNLSIVNGQLGASAGIVGSAAPFLI